MQPFLEKYGKQLLIPGGIGIVVLFYLFFLQDSSESSSIETIDSIATLAAIDTPSTEQAPSEVPIPIQTIMIDVKGAVKYPGVYTLNDGQRIVDAVEMAGGYAEGANPSLINHAQKLQDEMVIYIPRVGEELTETMEQLVQVSQAGGSSSGSGGVNSAGKVNLNKASESELTQLPGIGPSKATAIVKYRTEQGTFQTAEDLKKVTGIGEKTFEQLKDLIDVK